MTPTFARPAIWTACALLALVGLAGVVTAAVLLSQAFSDPNDEWDGLVYFLAALSGGLGLVLLVMATTVAWVARRHARAAGLTLCLVGCAGSALGAATAHSLGSVVTTGPVLGGLLVAGLGFAGFLGAGRTVDSPGDHPG